MHLDQENLTVQQRAAAERCLAVLLGTLQARQIVLAGYAGTGKTWTTGAIVRALLAADRRVTVLAPTHKALAQVRARLPEGVATYTIHQGLGLRMRRDDDGELRAMPAGSPPVRHAHCVVVDEASMVGDSLYAMLQVAVEGRPVLWVGDPAQLPPVRDGDESPVWERVSEQVRLTEIVRQADGSGIAQASLMVRQAIEDNRRVQLRDLQSYAGDEIMVVPGGVGVVADIVVDGIRAGLDCRAIAFRNDPVLQIADMVHAATHPAGAHRYSEGDPVVFGRQYGQSENDRIANNTEGVVAGVEGEEEVEGVPAWRVRVRFADDCPSVLVPADLREHERRLGATKRALKTANQQWEKARNRETGERRAEALRLLGLYQDGFADLRHTYASTAHKAQGSTYDAAVLHWRDLCLMRRDLDFNRAVYVALTRPSRYLCVVGS